MGFYCAHGFIMMICAVATNTDGTDRELKAIRKRTGMKLEAFAERVGISATTYKNYEYGGTVSVPAPVMNAARALDRDMVGPFSVPVAVAGTLIPHVGQISAGMKPDWTDPLTQAESFEPVPPGFEGKDRFSATVLGDCMIPMLRPGDKAVFQADPIQKLGKVVMWRNFDGMISVKHLIHDGREFILHPLNPSYEDTRAEGVQVGFLVGIIRDDDGEEFTRRNAKGLRP